MDPANQAHFIEDEYQQAERIAGSIGFALRMRKAAPHGQYGYKLLYHRKMVAGANFDLTLCDVERLCGDFDFIAESISLQHI